MVVIFHLANSSICTIVVQTLKCPQPKSGPNFKYNPVLNSDPVLYICGPELGQVDRKEGNVLFNDALNTFHLWLYGVRHMVDR